MNIPKWLALNVSKLFVLNAAQGFTLIELIVVMGIIGILVVGLLAAINPVEQINRAKDSAQKVAVKEIGQAILRYQSSAQTWPWTTLGTGTETEAPAVGNSAGATAAIPNLIVNGDLKVGYIAPTGILFWGSDNGGNPKLQGCFVPVSKSVQGDSLNSKWKYTAGTPGTPPVVDASCVVGSTCYYCVTFN